MTKFGGYTEVPALAEFYDFTPPYLERADVDFYVTHAKDAGGKILELGCGTGRILIPTAEAGCTIYGLDASEYMLAQCRRKLKDKPLDVQNRVQIVQSSMCDFKLDETFDLITIPFRAFQHLLSVEEQTACLKCAHEHLNSNGRLVFDVFQVNLKYINNPDVRSEMEDFPDVALPDGRKMRRTHRIGGFHRAEQYNDVEMIFYVTHPDGRKERIVQAFPFRYFFRYEMEHLLARCGFKVTELYGDFDKSPLSDDSPEMIFIAKKR